MIQKKKILMVLATQFGYHTDTYMYCKYIDKNKYYIYYFCFDVGLPKVQLKNVNVTYISMKTNRIINYLNFLYRLRIFIKNQKFDLIINIYARFTLLIRLLNPFQNMVLDIRTGDLSDNELKLWIMNKKINFTSFFYKNISIVSTSLMERLKLNLKKTTVLPLGGELQNIPPKTFSTIKLLYVGSLNNRNIHETVLGLAEYLKSNEAMQEITYDIVGFGNARVVEQLINSIEKTGLVGTVVFHGRKNQDELLYFYEKCNVGVVYVPQTKVYDCQPATKLFESLLAGMPVIATKTKENLRLLKAGCGALTEDNPNGFSIALTELIQNRYKFVSEQIKKFYLEYTWQNIIQNKLEPYLDSKFIMK